MKVFIDTSAFIALILKDESFHEKVVNKYKVYKKSRAQLITSDYVLDEQNLSQKVKQLKFQEGKNLTGF